MRHIKTKILNLLNKKFFQFDKIILVKTKVKKDLKSGNEVIDKKIMNNFSKDIIFNIFCIFRNIVIQLLSKKL